jgi:hypothetical protein
VIFAKSASVERIMYSMAAIPSVALVVPGLALDPKPEEL